MKCNLRQIAPGVFRCSVCRRTFLQRGEVALDKECRATPNDCIHFGAVIGKHLCELCSRKGVEIKVYECALHGKCVLSQWTANGKKIREAGEVSCLTCRDKTK